MCRVLISLVRILDQVKSRTSTIHQSISIVGCKGSKSEAVSFRQQDSFLKTKEKKQRRDTSCKDSSHTPRTIFFVRGIFETANFFRLQLIY